MRGETFGANPNAGVPLFLGANPCCFPSKTTYSFGFSFGSLQNYAFFGGILKKDRPAWISNNEFNTFKQVGPTLTPVG